MAGGIDDGIGKRAVVAYVLGLYNFVLALFFFFFHAPNAAREIWPAFVIIGSISWILAPLLKAQ